MRNKWKKRSGEGYIDTCVLILCAGNETTSRAQVLSERLEIDPDIRWSRTGRIQLNEEVTVTLTIDVDIGFGGLGSFPIELTAQASGRSEVYWK